MLFEVVWVCGVVMCLCLYGWIVVVVGYGEVSV